jgi:ubiquinone/menaquinone biosynthesis C-methylase UbiE
MAEHPDLIRLKAEYAHRAGDVEKTDRYSLFNPAQLFSIQQRQRVVLKCLQQYGLYPLSDQRILEVGCGSGGVLLEMLSAGAAKRHLFGVELILDRIQNARQKLASLPLACADGQNLPFAEHSFNLVMQFTVFSSILDSEVKTQIAQEMMRVLRPEGMILWYDFWINPANRQTKGIRPMEIIELFPNCSIQLLRITLAPPLTRRLISISWGFCLLLEKMRIFNTHYLAAIQPIISRSI